MSGVLCTRYIQAKEPVAKNKLHFITGSIPHRKTQSEYEMKEWKHTTQEDTGRIGDERLEAYHRGRHSQNRR